MNLKVPYSYLLHPSRFQNISFYKRLSIYQNNFFPDSDINRKQSDPSKSLEIKRKHTISIDLDKNVATSITDGCYKAWDHAGIHKISCSYVPDELKVAIKSIQKGTDEKKLLQDARDLFNFIQKRRPQVEREEEISIRQNQTKKLIEGGALPSLAKDSSMDILDLPSKERQKLRKSCNSKIYRWKRLDYTDYKSIVYLTARMSPDIAVLRKIFAEIRKRVEDFEPTTLFDFGSGVGSVTWAMESTWPNVCKEALYVDSSSSMNNLSEKLMIEAFPDNPSGFGPKTKYYRQFLPASDNIKYDLVVSSRSLFEVGQLANRARTVDILWKKVNDGGFLVLVEEGTTYGHLLLMEVRDFLNELYNSKSSSVTMPIHVFSPCSHDKFCPRVSHPSNRPCYFTAKYQPLHTVDAADEPYSFVVFRKRFRSSDDLSASWPRIVQPVLKRTRMVITRMCVSSGELEERIISKAKSSSGLYEVSKHAQWGDRMPITFRDHLLPSDESASLPSIPAEKEILASSQSEGEMASLTSSSEGEMSSSEEEMLSLTPQSKGESSSSPSI